MKILVTGGLGYIGSHTAIELINKGYNVIIVDNLVNSNIKVLDNIEKITGKRPEFHKIDLRNKDELNSIFQNTIFSGIIHFAALKSVSDSVNNAKLYYDNNVGSTENLLEIISSRKEKIDLIFSSSCTVYGQAKKLPITEDSPVLNQESPYGETKKKCEEIISEFCKKNTNLNSISLRYFNPIGAHKSALIGELPNGVPQNLVPYITQTAIGLRKELTIFGSDYPTRDGTCIRDYIHVQDLAVAHVKALDFLLDNKVKDVFNVGTGKGLSVLDIINGFQAANELKLNYEFGPRREGDVEKIYSDGNKTKNILGWSAKKTTKEALISAWNWQISKNNT